MKYANLEKDTLCLVFVFLLAFGFWFAEAVASPGLSVIPESISVQKGEQFSVDIKIDEITELFGASLELVFDGEILEATGAEAGDIMGGDALFFSMPSEGKMSIAISRKQGDALISGSGVLAIIDFKAKLDGKSDIDFDDSGINLQKVDGSPVLDSDNLILSVCHVTVKTNVPEIALEPASQELDIGAEFDIEIKVKNITQLFGASMEIAYDSSLLEFSEAVEGDFLGGDVIFFSQTQGDSISIAISKKAGDEPANGTGTLALLKFKAKAEGNTSLSISEDKNRLRKSDGDPTPDIGALVLGAAQVMVIKPSVIKGDVNNDGKIRSNDAIITLRIAAGIMEPTEYQKQAADMNNDGKVRSNDAILILREAAGLLAP